MHIHLAANATTVDEEQRDGDRWLIARDVGLLKSKRLDGGYVPSANVEATVSLENTHGGTGWTGTSAIVDHHTNQPGDPWHDTAVVPEGAPVLAANDAVQAAHGVGQIESAHFDGEFVRGDIAVNADRAESLGDKHARVVSKLDAIRAGENASLDVSTQYLYADLPPGEYDGEYRSDVAQIVSPDGVALLPDKQGACSVEEGCGISPDAAGAPIPAVNAADADLPEVALSTGHNVDATDSTWRGLFGVLNRIATDLDRLRERIDGEGSPVSEELTADLHETARDVNEALGMARRVDENLGGDGLLPDGRDPDVAKAGVNVDTETLREAANQEGFPEWPWSRSEAGVKACKRDMRADGEDPELCFAWANSEGIDVGQNGDESAESDSGPTDHEPMKHGTNASSREVELDLMADTVAGVLEADDEDTYHSTVRLAASRLPGVTVQDLREAIPMDAEMSAEDIRELFSDMADTMNNPGTAGAGSTHRGMNTMDRDTYIDELAEQTDLKRESLEGMGDTCLERTHDSFLGGTGDGGGDDDPADADEETITIEKDELDSVVDERVEERVAANERQARVDRVIAQSDEWTDDDRDELLDVAANSEKAFEQIEEGATGGGFQMPARTGSADSIGANDDEPDVDFGTGKIGGDD